MTKKIKLEAIKRSEEDKNLHDLRTGGFVPAVLYGSGIENVNLKINANEFNKIYDDAGETNLIDLKVGKEEYKVLVKDVQKDVTKNKILHADFYQVNMKNEVTVDVPLVFTGESKAVKELAGTLVKAKDTITLTCLPGDMVDHVKVDISSLVTFNETIRYKDIVLPEKNTFDGDFEDLVAICEMPRSERVTASEDEEGEEGETKEGETKEGETKEGETKEGEKGTKSEDKKEDKKG